MPQRLRNIPRILVALIWSFAGFCFISVINPLLISQLALLPDGFAKVSIDCVSSPGIIILCGMLFGLISMLLWRRSSNQLVAIGIAILVPILLFCGTGKPDTIALRHAIAWGRLDAIKLMFGATSDDGKALIAELGNDALQANNVCTLTSDADRAQITQLLIARGAKSTNKP